MAGISQKQLRDLLNKESQFRYGVTRIDDIPDFRMPEFAFIGRSNVGKSSLLNSLVNKKNFARVSNTPGRTQQLNFFSVSDKFTLVDLPGYGYAKASKKDIAYWNELVKYYLLNSGNITRIFVLIDGRHGIKDSDREIMKMFDYYGRPYQMVMTKTDKSKKGELTKIMDSAVKEQENFTALHPEILCTSSKTGTGMKDLQFAISELL